MRGATSAKWVAGAVIVAMAATACSTSKDEAGGKGGNITVVLGEPQHGLVGQNTAESEGAEVLHALFTGLVDYDNKTNEPKLAAAESINTTDSKTWTIKVKDGLTFHNGEKVDAQSFVRAWNWGANQDNAAEGMPFFSKIEAPRSSRRARTRSPPPRSSRASRSLTSAPSPSR